MNQTVMIVDDALFVRTVLRALLTEMGYQVIAQAESGLEAMRQLHEHQPDIVLLDIILPDANGIDILDAIRQHHPEVRVVICSSIGQDSTIQKALQHGAAGYLQKPFTKDSVSAAMSRLPAA
jgi:two-component system, chemotaxis family, chemotaxis protein CheY